MKFLTIKTHHYVVGLFILFCLFLTYLYSDYLINDPILGRDDLLLIFPLKPIASLGGYVEAVKNNTILDFQPLRDLSFFMNIKLMEWTGVSTFHLTNFLLFIFSVTLFTKLLNVLGFSKKQVYLSAACFAVHPIMISAVGWISARKHILALVFILMTLIEFHKHKKITLKSVFYYLCSILSHQIFILLPLWILIYSKAERWRINLNNYLLMSSLGTIVLTVGILKTFYLSMGNVTYRYYHWFENVSRYVLSLGRSVIQIFFPYSISTDYFQGSPLNIIGIPLLVIILFVSYKGKNSKDVFLWLGLALVAHILTYITFVNDTYLYLPLICFIISLNYYIKNNPIKMHPKVGFALVVISVILLSLKTLDASQMWRSNKDLWQYSYENERSPYTSIVLGAQILKQNEDLGLEFIIWGAENLDLLGNQNIFDFFIQTIYKSNLSIQKKIQIFKDFYIDFDIYKAYYALALIQGNEIQARQGIDILKPLLATIDTKTRQESIGIDLIKSIKRLCNKETISKSICFDLEINIE